jgi:hypothetical protein
MDPRDAKIKKLQKTVRLLLLALSKYEEAHDVMVAVVAEVLDKGEVKDSDDVLLH